MKINLSFCFVIFLLFSLKSYSQNNALDFDGFDDIAQTTSFNIENEFTISYWFKSSENTSRFDDRIFALGASSRLEFGIANYNCTSGRFWLYDSRGQGVKCTEGPLLRDDEWHLIAISKTGGSLNIYIDEVEIYSLSSSSTAVYGPYFRLGAWTGGLGTRTGFNGLLDEVRIWDHGQTKDEILMNVYAELSGEEQGLIAYYNFNQGVAGEDNTDIGFLNDKSLNQNHLQLINFDLLGNSSNFVSSSVPLIQDLDGDGIIDEEDNCVETPNTDQTDFDFDKIGDACDDGVNIDLIAYHILDSLSGLSINGINGLNAKLDEIIQLCNDFKEDEVLEKIQSLKNQISAKIGKGISSEQGDYFLNLLSSMELEIIAGNSSCSNNEFSSDTNHNTQMRNGVISDVVKVYPNPVETYLYISAAENAEIKIFDQIGRLLVEKQGNKVNLTSLPNGFYVVLISSQGILTTERILKI